MTDLIYVGSLKDLQNYGSRKRLTVNGRDIFIMLHNDQLFAFDSYCYHAGGPLYLGEIEDLPENSCIVCPWHKYRISLQSGEGLYNSVDPHNLQKPPQLCSKGIKQRMHTVSRQDDKLYVTLSDKPNGTIESDHYNNGV